MANNKFTLNSLIDEVEKDLIKAEKRQLRKAANFFNRKLRAKIKSENLVDQGNLLKGVSNVSLDHASLVGIGAPGFHALLIELGHDVVLPAGHSPAKRGKNKPKAKKVVAGKHFYLETMQESTTELEKILGEEWL